LNSESLTRHRVIVLLVDDQAMIGEAVRRMLASESDIVYHYCNDPTVALSKAEELKPTVILQDLVMPQIDGMTLVKQFRSNPNTRDVPLIVLSTKEDPKIKAEGFSCGANDYLVKLPDRIELIARVRYHSQGYINLLQRNEAYDALRKSQAALAQELHEAAAYVRSILPPPLTGEISACWKFIPSTSLGGDAFGYHWLDDNHFAIYLLDVCGHGVGAALLSISAINVLRAQSLRSTDFRDPGQVLGALNETFQMEKQNDMYFTIWYGVFEKTRRRLVYASGGHPPAVLVGGRPASPPAVALLRTPMLAIGSMPGIQFQTASCEVAPASRLFVFSDGTYELAQKDGGMLQLNQFVDLLSQPGAEGPADLDRILAYAQSVTGQPNFEDDFSIMRIDFA
jgi:sigma-B regulation protein RsbU (phosphoserine phosphatase)